MSATTSLRSRTSGWDGSSRLKMSIWRVSPLPRAAACFRAQELVVVPVPCEFRTTRFRWGLSTVLPGHGALRDWELVLHEWVGRARYAATGRTGASGAGRRVIWHQGARTARTGNPGGSSRYCSYFAASAS